MQKTFFVFKIKLMMTELAFVFVNCIYCNLLPWTVIQMHQCLTLYCAFLITWIKIAHKCCLQLLLISESLNPKHSLQVFLKEVNVVCVCQIDADKVSRGVSDSQMNDLSPITLSLWVQVRGSKEKREKKLMGMRGGGVKGGMTCEIDAI